MKGNKYGIKKYFIKLNASHDAKLQIQNITENQLIINYFTVNFKL